MKLTKRKGFNFFRSYFDVYNELVNDSDKVAFIDAVLNRQFLGVKPENLKGMARFAYISQTNSIDSQVKGYEDKTGIKLNSTPTDGCAEPPTEQVEVEVEVEEKGKEKVEVQEQSNKKTILVFESYNRFAETHNIPKIKKFTASRKRLALARLKTPEDLKTVFLKISQSDFLLGDSFNVSFDWIFKQSNFNKILEGNYDNKNQVNKKPKRSAADALREKVYGTSNNQ
jgi:hypothetical protein